MTFGEISDKVQFKIWGTSTPPQGAVAQLEGQDGIICDCHRKIQQKYNYWFMQGYTSFPTVANLQAYPLPADYKELISVQFKVYGTDYFQEPMSPLGLKEAQYYKWTENADPVEYPTWFELIGESIVLYPAPSTANYYFHMVYWGFLMRPTDALFQTTEDELTMYGGTAIVNMAVAEMKDVLEEYQAAEMWRRKAEDEIESLKEEDRRRRQSQIAEVLMTDGI